MYDQRTKLGLDAQGVRLVEKYDSDFVRDGAKLSDADKTTLKAMNAEPANLGTTFSQNVLAEVNATAVVVDELKQLDGLSEEQIAAAAEAAKARNLDGKYVIALLNTTGQPPLTQLKNRELRKKIYNASVSHGSHGGQYDNTALVARIMKLRADKAKLLGFPTYAVYRLEKPDRQDARSGQRDAGQTGAGCGVQCQARSRRSAGHDRQGTKRPRASRPSSWKPGIGPTTARRCASPIITSTNRRSSPTSS